MSSLRWPGSFRSARRITIKIVLIVVTVCVTGMFLFGLGYLASEYSSPRIYEETVIRNAFAYEVDANLVFAVIKAESKFRPKAVSKKGAQGLMQLMRTTALFVADRLGENPEGVDLLDPEQNIRYGTYYLSYLIEKFQNVDFAILAYNAGEGTVRKWIREGLTPERAAEAPYPETAAYFQKVKRYYGMYCRKYSY